MKITKEPLLAGRKFVWLFDGSQSQGKHKDYDFGTVLNLRVDIEHHASGGTYQCLFQNRMSDPFANRLCQR